MKIFTRIATALTAAFVSVFFAAPAFAAGGHGDEKIDTLEPFSAAGDPVNWVAILIVGAVVLAIVLGLAQLVGKPFSKAFADSSE